MAYTTEQIEDAITTALTPLIASIGIRTLKTYQGELERSEKEIIRLFPAIVVTYGGSTYTEHGGRKLEKMLFHIFCCDKSLRKEADARRGGVTNPGTYAMLHSVRDVMTSQMLDLEINPFKIIKEMPVKFELSRGISIYAAQYETTQYHLYPAA